MDTDRFAPRAAEMLLSVCTLSRADLLGRGTTARAITDLVAAGVLIRLRNGHYVGADTDPNLVAAGRLGARLDCISLLSRLGVFVHTHTSLHVQVEKGLTRLPQPADGVVRHWRPSQCPDRSLTTTPVDALAQAVRCQGGDEAVATLDSAWHQGLVGEADIDAVFAQLPRRHRRLQHLLDPRAESGPETLMRLLLHRLGCHVDVQVRIRSVGRVDFVVDGWLIIECDSRGYHSGWEQRKHDMMRDIHAAALGYTTIRPLAEDILYRREGVRRLIERILASHRA